MKDPPPRRGIPQTLSERGDLNHAVLRAWGSTAGQWSTAEEVLGSLKIRRLKPSKETRG